MAIPRPSGGSSQRLRDLRNQSTTSPEMAATQLADAQIHAVLLTRFFNRPTNLADDDPVTLSLPTCGLMRGVFVNDQALASQAECAAQPGEDLYQIVAPLQRRNRIDVFYDLRRSPLDETRQANLGVAQQIVSIVEQARLLLNLE